ncbi:MAG TPA: lactonase family protein [Blastocatellia bacterium]|nr:lactonase family protein [Blastocatellia bacterium]
MTQHIFTRREFFSATTLGTISLLAAHRLKAQPLLNTQEMLVYIGTYTTGKSEGIYVYRLDLASGALKRQSVTGGIVNPSFVAIDPRRRFLYSVAETSEFNGRKSGAVSAYAIDQKTGDLKALNQQPSMGTGPCYVAVERTGRFVLTANYGGGSVTVLPVRKDGSLGPPTDTIQHTGSSINRDRQAGPHAHCIVPDASGRFALAADLGLDKVMIYRFDAKKGKLRPHTPPFAALKPGAGPRHIAFHPDGQFAYVINELDSTLVAFSYDKTNGTLTELQISPTLPDGFKGTNYCADVHVHPSGQFVYASNRGHDSIAVFGIDRKTGRLIFIEHASTQGNWPRNFALDPTGTFLLAANQKSDSIITYRIDQQSGRLTPTGRMIEIPAPVCLKLIPAFS